jgi:hypothetical protein
MSNAGWLLMVLAPIVLAACGGDHDDSSVDSAPPLGTYANLQVVNTSLGAPPIDVLLDGKPFVTHLDYGEGTGEQPITPTSHSLIVQIETPGSPTTVIGPTTLDAAANMDYVVAVEGNVVSLQVPGVSFLIIPHQLAVVPPQSTRLQVINAYSAPINLYVSAVGAPFSSATQVGTASPGESVGPLMVSSSELWLSDPESPIGLTGPITLAGGADLVYSVLMPVQIPAELFDQPCCQYAVSIVDALGDNSWLSGAAGLRVINDSANAPALAITSNGDLTAPVISSLAFEGSTYYLGIGKPLAVVAPGVYGYNFAITPASNLSDVLASQAVELKAGAYTWYSLYALGPLAQIFPFITRDDFRSYSTQARLRFIQGSPSARLVDVYLTAAGAGIPNATPTYAGMPFATDTGFVSYVQGSYDLTVTSAGTKAPIIGPVSVTLNNGGVYTAVARDAPGGGAPYGLIKLDNLLSP